jgi:imidazolonepropionase-like amidohydrolase
VTFSLLIRHARIIDVRVGEVSEGDVAIHDGVVQEVGGHITSSGAQRTIDAGGAYLLPGLIDAHVHVNAIDANLGALWKYAPSYVALKAARVLRGMRDRGFTTVRDTGGADFGIAEAQQAGLIDGPRVIYGGKALSQTGGHGDRRTPGESLYESHPSEPGLSRIVDGVDAVRLAAREELRRGASHIKMHVSGGVASPTDQVDESQYSMDELRAVAEEATNAGAYLTVHAYPSAAIRRAVEAGARCVEHGNLADDDTLAFIRDAGAFLVPTIVTYWALQREGLKHGLARVSWEKVSKVLDVATATLERAHALGVKLAYGSDLLGPMHRHQSEEFRIRAEVLSPLAIIQSATLVGAELIRRPDLGIIETGGTADLILLDGNPLDRIGVLADPANHLKAVIQGGEVVRAGEQPRR